MMQARQAITRQHFSTQLWSVRAGSEQQSLVCIKSRELLGEAITPESLNATWINVAATTIKIEQVRELQTALSFSSGTTRFVFLLYADLLTIPAQQATLKLLEEPPLNTQLILVSDKPQKLLPTIRSRCSEVKLLAEKATDEEDMANHYQSWKQLSVSEVIAQAENYKKLEAAEPVLRALMLFLRNTELPKSGTTALTRKSIITDLTTCLTGLEQLSKAVNPQLVVETVLFKLSGHLPTKLAGL